MPVVVVAGRKDLPVVRQNRVAELVVDSLVALARRGLELGVKRGLVEGDIAEEERMQVGRLVVGRVGNLVHPGVVELGERRARLRGREVRRRRVCRPLILFPSFYPCRR